MNRVRRLAALSTVVAVLTTGTALADQISGPFAVGKLNVFLLRPDVGVAQPKQGYSSVEAALGSKTLQITETGIIGKLLIENTGELPVLLHVGDMLNGGMQDRVVRRSVLIPPRSGPRLIDTLCAEQGRWSPSGSAGHFASSGIKFPYMAEISPFGQSMTWTTAAAYQQALQAAVGGGVIDSRHPSSLPRTVQKFVKAQGDVAEFSNVPFAGATGYVVVKDGNVIAAEEFESAEMLAASWAKLMRSAAVAAVLAPTASGKVTSSTDVETYLKARAEAGGVTDAFGSDGALLHRVIHTHWKGPGQIRAPLLQGSGADVHGPGWDEELIREQMRRMWPYTWPPRLRQYIPREQFRTMSPPRRR